MYINNENNIFLRQRILTYIDVIISKKNTYDEMIKEPIEAIKILVTKDEKTKILSLNGKSYEIGFKKYFYIKYSDTFCKLVSKQSSTRNSENNLIGSNKSRKSSSSILSNPYIPKIFEDEEKNFYNVGSKGARI